jgi:hypothetical protein
MHSTHLSAADRIGPFAGAGLTEECDKQFGLLIEMGKRCKYRLHAFGPLPVALVQKSELMILVANAENCRSHQTI